jgi:2-succinyl-5-enolpyruvyl-6-hydroxy-3-cyclohexene-1-carboxylate synthase
MALPFKLADFLSKMPVAITADSNYKKRWETLKQTSLEVTDKYTSNIAFSDFKVFDEIFRVLPVKCNLQLGNSSPVRYAQYFSLPPSTYVNSNRGTSGIDGCVSTATGAAIANNKLTVCIVGDISFFYDSNALWNNYLSPMLRIIIINNGGGNIFRMVDGATSVKNFQTFFETPHQLSAKHLASMYELPYYICTSFEELQQSLPKFFEESSKAQILEVKTDNEVSAAVHKQYFEFIKENK